jgi:hypothetical protein
MAVGIVLQLEQSDIFGTSSGLYPVRLQEEEKNVTTVLKFSEFMTYIKYCFSGFQGDRTIYKFRFLAISINVVFNL